MKIVKSAAILNSLLKAIREYRTGEPIRSSLSRPVFHIEPIYFALRFSLQYFTYNDYITSRRRKEPISVLKCIFSCTALSVFICLFALPTMAQRPHSHFEIIRHAAIGANSGHREDVRQYVSTVTDAFLPHGPIKDLIDDRITTLHLKHLAATLSSVSEDTLVTALNRLADKIGLPEYGKTNPIEFRLFRVRMLQLMPELNSAALTKPDEFMGASGQSQERLSSTMQPVEITYLICSLALQKRVNPDFQMTELEMRQRYDAHRRNYSTGKEPIETNNSNTIGDHRALHASFDPERGKTINAAMASFASKTASVENFNSILNSFLGEIGYAQ